MRKVPKVRKRSDTLLLSSPCLWKAGLEHNSRFFSDSPAEVRLLGAAAALRGLTERFPTQRSDGLRCFSTTSIVHSPPGRGAPTRSPGSQRAQNALLRASARVP